MDEETEARRLLRDLQARVAHLPELAPRLPFWTALGIALSRLVRGKA